MQSASKRSHSFLGSFTKGETTKGETESFCTNEGRDRDLNKHKLVTYSIRWAQERRDSEGRDRDKISREGRDVSSVSPFKGETRKLCSVSIFTDNKSASHTEIADSYWLEVTEVSLKNKKGMIRGEDEGNTATSIA